MSFNPNFPVKQVKESFYLRDGENEAHRSCDLPQATQVSDRARARTQVLNPMCPRVTGAVSSALLILTDNTQSEKPQVASSLTAQSNLKKNFSFQRVEEKILSLFFLVVDGHNSFVLFIYLCAAEDRTQCLMHAMQVLNH